MKQKNDWVGQTKKNADGWIMTIIKYINYSNVIVQFEDGATKTVYLQHWIENHIAHPRYGKSYYGRGYIDRTIEPFEQVRTYQSYNKWRAMFDRCYGPHKNNNRVYEGCEVDQEWYNYYNFKAWYDENFYQIPKDNMELDKDIIIFNNKIYSSKTCLIVPRYINSFFIEHVVSEVGYPGVSIHKNKYRVISLPKHQLFNTAEEGFAAYVKYKEDKLKNYITQNEQYFPQKVLDILKNIDMFKYYHEVYQIKK